MESGTVALVVIIAMVIGAAVLYAVTKINPEKKSGVKKDLEK